MPGYSRHFLIYDSVLSFAVGILLALTVYFTIGESTINSTLHGVRLSLYTAIVTISGSLLGFTIATVALLQTLLAVRATRYLRNNPNVFDLYSSFFQAAFCLALLTAASLMAIFLDKDSEPQVVVPMIVFILITVAVGKLSRAIWVFRLLVRITARSKG